VYTAQAPNIGLGIFKRNLLRMDCSESRLKELVSLEEVKFDADIAGPGVSQSPIVHHTRQLTRIRYWLLSSSRL
jgi:hypothetical protein